MENRMRILKNKLGIILKHFKSNRGFSLVEVIVAIGLTGVVTLGVMNLTEKSQDQTIIIKQNIEQDNYIRSLRKFMLNPANCNQVLKSSGSGLSADLSVFDYTLNSGIKVEGARVLLPQATTGVEVKPVTILIDFKRDIKGMEQTAAVKKITAAAEFNGSAFVGCSNYDAESEKAAFKISCEMLGGTFVDGVSGSEQCDFSIMDPNSEIFKQAKKKACTDVFGGTFLNGKCTTLNMALEAHGTNIKAGNYLISGANVSTFDQKCPGTNSFIAGVNADGSVKCKTVKFCTKCDANCPASGSICNGPSVNVVGPSNPCDGAPAASSVCSGEERVAGYPICGMGTKSCVVTDPCEGAPDPSTVCKDEELVPGNSACGVGTKEGCEVVTCPTDTTYRLNGNTCEAITYTESDGKCNENTVVDQTLGSCEKFMSGTCSGSARGIVEAETSTPECSPSSCNWNKADQDIMNGGAPMNTTSMPLCKDYYGNSCSKGDKVSCTMEKRNPGEGITLTCCETPVKVKKKDCEYRRPYGYGQNHSGGNHHNCTEYMNPYGNFTTVTLAHGSQTRIKFKKCFTHISSTQNGWYSATPDSYVEIKCNDGTIESSYNYCECQIMESD